MIYVVRHGERSDHNSQKHRYGSSPEDFDPSLTQLGIMQSIQTGEYLNDQITKLKLKGALIVTSPYLRCVQTTVHLLKPLKCQIYENTIFSSFGIGEFFKENWFNRNVLDELTLYKNPGLINSQYEIKEVNFEQTRQTYPESATQFFGRFAENYNRLKQFFSNHFSEYALILITHGIQQLIRLLQELEYAPYLLAKSKETLQRISNIVRFQHLIAQKRKHNSY